MKLQVGLGGGSGWRWRVWLGFTLSSSNKSSFCQTQNNSMLTFMLSVIRNVSWNYDSIQFVTILLPVLNQRLLPYIMFLKLLQFKIYLYI